MSNPYTPPAEPRRDTVAWLVPAILYLYFAVCLVDIYFQTTNGSVDWACIHNNDGKAVICISTGDWSSE